MRGRPPASSPEERRRVYQLADAGQSSRAIAESVFGSRRLNNRVLRLLERRRRTTFRGVNLEEATDGRRLGRVGARARTTARQLLGRLPHIQAHLRDDPLAARLERRPGAALVGHHKPSFTLDTYVSLLDEDIPEPTFFDELTSSGDQPGDPGQTKPAEVATGAEAENLRISGGKVS